MKTSTRGNPGKRLLAGAVCGFLPARGSLWSARQK